MDLAEAAARSYALQASNASAHPSLFNEFVLRDENTGDPIVSAPIHDQLIAFIQKHDRVVVEASPEMGKTQQLVGYMLRELGEDPTGRWRGLIGSKIAANAMKPSRQMQRYIANSPEFQLCYPHIRPGQPWRADGWKVEGAKFGDPKDMTISTCGVGGSILGSRVNFGLLDDIFDWENTRTEYRSDQVVEWILQLLEGRMLAGGKIVLLKNAWREWDGGRKLVEHHGWKLFRLTARDPATKRSNWPAVWPQARLDSYPPAIAPLHLDTEATKDGSRLVEEAWIQACMANGNGLTMIKRLTPAMMPPGAYCVTGVDLNHKKKKTSDLTVFFTIMVIPDEAGRPAWLRVIWIESAVMNSPEIKATLVDHYDRYGSKFLVEDNAAQSYIVDDCHLARPEIVVEPFTTGVNKWHPEYGIGGIAIEMSQGAWVLPSMPEGDHLVCEPALETWLGHLRRFTASGHTADDIMAGWFAWRGARDVFAHRVDTAGDLDYAEPLTQEERREAERQVQGASLWAIVDKMGIGMPSVDDDVDSIEPASVSADQWMTMDRT